MEMHFQKTSFSPLAFFFFSVIPICSLDRYCVLKEGEQKIHHGSLIELHFLLILFAVSCENCIYLFFWGGEKLLGVHTTCLPAL